MAHSDVPTLVIAAGRERSLLRRHPWVFSGGVAEIRGAPQSGDTVRVCANDGSFLGWAAYSPHSQIVARVWDFEPDARIDAEFFERRLSAALALRTELLGPSTTSLRLVHAESDGLPGLVVDRYGQQLVLQATSAGAARHRGDVARLLQRLTGVDNVYERSEGEPIELEGLSPQRGVLAGSEPQTPMIIEEQGVRFGLDVCGGHKTGFYLDQRENRALVRALAVGRQVLDCFCYSGGFAIGAALGGASQVTALDSSEAALGLGRSNAALNGLAPERIDWQRADVFEWLRRARDRRASFDLIVLDPPKLAPSVRLVERAARAYKDINLLALKLLRPGGLLFTFSCSGAVSGALLQKIVAGAAVDARVNAAIVRRLQAGGDHPVGLAFPEGEYLKGLMCRAA